MATVKIYKTDITRSKNGIFDDLATYLGTLTEVYDFANVQHQKIAMDLSIKLEIPQDKLGVANGNYLDLYQDNQHFYFFITSAVWTSKDVLQFVLSLDTLNTFKDYRFNSKTTINRQHKDRIGKTVYPAATESVESWLNDTDTWEWSTAAGEIIGEAFFQLDKESFKDRNSEEFTISQVTVEGQGADVYSYDVDAEKSVLHVIAYVQGEGAEIPVGKVRFTASVPQRITNIYRLVDLQSEGIEAPLFKVNEEILRETTNKGIKTISDYNSYNLIYKTKNAYTANDNDKFIYDNPIDLYIAGDEDSEWKASAELEVSGSDLNIDNRGEMICFPTGAEGKRMFNSFPLLTEAETKPNEVNVSIYYDNKFIKKVRLYTKYVNKKESRLKQKCLVLWKDNDNNKYRILECILKRDNFLESVKVGDAYADKTKIKLVFDTPEVYIYHTNDTTDFWNTDNPYVRSMWRRYHERYDSSATEHFTGTETSTVTVKGLNSWVRTDPQLVKIISLPYAPLDYRLPQEGLKYEDGNISYDFTNNRFPEAIERDMNLAHQYGEGWNNFGNLTPLDLFDPNVSLYSQPSPSDNRYVYGVNSLYEIDSKMFHSDFQHIDFVYDNFSYVFRNELIDPEAAQVIYHNCTHGINCKFTVSNTVASTFMFDFKDYWPLSESYQSYDTIVVVNRNNEVPIYNNYYLNYLRNGYNYDVKNKNQQKIASGIGIGLSAASMAAGIALSATGVGAAVGASAIAGGAIGLASSLTSAISSSVQADRNLQQKLENAKNQSESVQGADDIGLLKVYTDGNKAKMVHYRVSDNTYKKISDLLYYCGYKCDYQDIPDTTSRYWFNFIQCDPVFDESYDTIYCNYIDDIKAKFREGVTVYHYHDGYNFTQDKENWETWLIGE